MQDMENFQQNIQTFIKRCLQRVLKASGQKSGKTQKAKSINQQTDTDMEPTKQKKQKKTCNHLKKDKGLRLTCCHGCCGIKKDPYTTLKQHYSYIARVDRVMASRGVNAFIQRLILHATLLNCLYRS